MELTEMAVSIARSSTSALRRAKALQQFRRKP